MNNADGDFNRFLILTRRIFHEYPEPSFSEFNTAKRIEDILRGFGLTPVRIANTGVYVDINGNRAGPTVAYRADIDALPVIEKNDLEYKSKNQGFMHACGHDCHITIALGIAKLFSENRDYPGIVRVFFQPAEESPPGGAVKMIEGGILKNVNYVLGLHVTSEFETGSIGIKSGPVNSYPDSFYVKIIGKGGHGSLPHKSIDTIYIAAEYITLIQTIVSRKVDPVRPAVITVGKINGGYRHNIIADEVTMEGTVRTQDKETQELIKEELERTLSGICSATHSQYEYKFEYGYPVMVNDPEIAKIIENTASDILGKSKINKMIQRMGGEDFGYYTEKVKGAYYYLGVGNKAKGITSPNHSPTWLVDENSLSIGVKISTEVIKKLLKNGSNI